MRCLLMSLAALGMLAACGSTNTPTDDQTSATETPVAAPANRAEATAQDTCGASRFAHLIGTQAAQIDRASLPPNARVITPDMMVTMDFLAERLNVIVGTDGRVGSLECF